MAPPAGKAKKTRLPRTESQKRRSAAKGAETRARNKAARAVQANGSSSSGTSQPVPHDQGQNPSNENALDASNTSNMVPTASNVSTAPNASNMAPTASTAPNTSNVASNTSSTVSNASNTLTTPPGHPTSHANAPLLPSTQSSSVTQRQASDPPSDEETGQSSAGPSSGSTTRREREKKLIPYRTYNPKEALGLAGPENKMRWLMLRDTVRSLLSAQKFQATKSWTKHTLTQRAVVISEVPKELMKQANHDAVWDRVIRQPMFSQVIEDIARDCCSNKNSYTSKKNKSRTRQF